MFYLGVDGGGTKTAFILINECGKIIANTVQNGCSYLQLTKEEIFEILNDGVVELCQQAEIEITDIDYAFWGLPVYGEIPAATLFLEATVAKIMCGNNFTCGNDVEAGWAGSLACQSGINLVAGTGAIGFGRDQHGNSARASGWDYFLGDEGSAYWLGKKVLSLFSKEADGRIEKSQLYYLLKEKFGLNNDLDLIAVVHDSLQLKRDKIAQLALILYEAALAGDEKAIQIYDEAANEHSLTVNALLAQLDFSVNEQILISFSGGVFQAGDLILKPLKEYIQSDNVKLIEPILQPVNGAALYALILHQNLSEYYLIVDRLRADEKVLLK